VPGARDGCVRRASTVPPAVSASIRAKLEHARKPATAASAAARINMGIS
jgi:hypothetical protein